MCLCGLRMCGVVYLACVFLGSLIDFLFGVFLGCC